MGLRINENLIEQKEKGNLSELNLLKREIKFEIRRAKLYYKDRLERELGQNNLGSA